jgi:hypothetical protein
MSPEVLHLLFFICFQLEKAVSFSFFFSFCFCPATQDRKYVVGLSDYSAFIYCDMKICRLDWIVEVQEEMRMFFETTC